MDDKMTNSPQRECDRAKVTHTLWAYKKIGHSRLTEVKCVQQSH